jgi:hypothetical protein
MSDLAIMRQLKLSSQTASNRSIPSATLASDQSSPPVEPAQYARRIAGAGRSVTDDGKDFGPSKARNIWTWCVITSTL